MGKVFKYYVIYKPFRVLCQFSPVSGKLTLGDLYDLPKDIYPVGRLDYESEGLLILSNDNYLKTKLLDPTENHKKTYYVQVEGEPHQSDIQRLVEGVDINVKGVTYKVKGISATIINEPTLPVRNPPIRLRKNIPTSWLSITVNEGKYHQIRKMTAKIGFPTLRLVRYSIENLTIDDIKISRINSFSKNLLYKKFNL